MADALDKIAPRRAGSARYTTPISPAFEDFADNSRSVELTLNGKITRT